MKELVVLLVIVSCMFASFGRGALVDPQVAVRALETQGYSDVKIIDHVWFAVGVRGCGQEDAARFTAVAKNPAGNLVAKLAK